MTETEKLYYTDPFECEFNATVLDIKRGDIGPYEVILDKTEFFPESGGQVADRGTLGGSEVMDVKIQDGIISHLVSFTEPGTRVPSIGDTISGTVDFDFRFSNMQQHTGEHIFSGLVKRHFGYENVGFHLSENTVTMDYDGPLTPAQIYALEEGANSIIMMDVPVKVYFPTDEELSTLDYRAKLDVETMGRVRIVDIYKTDVCACCAPHTATTGQVGILKVVNFEKYKGGVRIFILCGNRAYKDYKMKQDVILRLSGLLSVPAKELEDSVLRLSKDISALRETVNSYEKDALDRCIENAVKNDDSLIFSNVANQILLRNAANEMMEKFDRPVFLFNGNDEAGYNFIIGSKKDDAVLLLHRLSKVLNIKGGGKNPMVKGSCQDLKSDINKAVKDLF